MELYAEKAIAVTFVLASSALTDKGLDMAQKLSLYRLAARAKLAHMPSLPKVGGQFMCLTVQRNNEFVGVTTGDATEAIPGSNWGTGQARPLVHGPLHSRPIFEEIAADRLILLSNGNARLVWLDSQLDGPANGFGLRFWKALAAAAPLAIAAVREQGVATAIYSDRYLLTPLNCGLLHQVITAMPGASNLTKVEVNTAHIDRPHHTGSNSYPFHSFPEDSLRSSVLGELFPGGKIVTLPKSQQSHSRCLALTIGDGRTFRVLLDQGLGAWRVIGTPPRHDFLATPQKQATDIKGRTMQVGISDMRGSPAILEMV